MKKLKDKIYELEGLVELADRRPDKFEDLRPLIQSRLDDVCKAWEAIPASDPKEEKKAEPQPEPCPAPEPEEITESITDDEAWTPTETMKPSEPEKPVKAAAPQPERKGIALCLNDRFRFTRLLAAGDRKEFDRVMAEVAGQGDYESARDYLIESRGLDPSDPDVADMLEIVQQYYED